MDVFCVSLIAKNLWGKKTGQHIFAVPFWAMLVTEGEKINEENCALGKKHWANGKPACFKQKPDKTGST